MDDSTYTFIQHQRETKATARGARSRKSGAHSRKVTLPSDHLTPAQKRRLNGTVQTYDMNKPHTLAELKLWPVDLRHEYMQKLIDTYLPNNTDLADMLGCPTSSVSYVLGTHFVIHRSRGYTPSPDNTDFLRFILDEPAPMPEPAPEPEPLPEVHSWPGTITNPAGTVLYDTITAQFTGTVDDLIRVIQTGPIHLAGADTYTFTIRAARKEG